MPTRAVISESAREFIESLRKDFRDVWEYQVLWQLVDDPFNEHTTRAPLPEDADALATIMGPFAIRFRLSDDGETVEIARINWRLGVPYWDP